MFNTMCFMKRLLVHALTVLLLSDTVFATSFVAYVTLANTTEPAKQALVVFSINDQERGRSITGDDGRCFLRDIPDGTYLVTISYRGKTSSFNGFVVPSAKYEFTIPAQ
jgi:hypothetical protein